MVFVGELLKKSRISKKVDIKTVSKDLNISFDILNKIEDDNFPEYLDKVYLTGHIRAYSKHLGLNSDEVVEKFREQTSFIPKSELNELPKPLIKENLFFISPKSFSLVSIVFICIGFYFLFITSNDLQPNYSIIPDMPENLQSEIEEIEMKTALNSIKNTNLSDETLEVLILDQNILDSKSLGIESSAIASLPSSNELRDLNEIIKLTFLKPTWIQIRNEQDQIVLSKLMNQNDEYSYSITEKYSLTAGNAGNILVAINGETRGKAGKNGEVIESLIIHSDFDN